MKELHELIRDLREDHDLRQKELARHLGISQQTYSNYENGHREIPTWAVVALAKYYGISTDYLLGVEAGYIASPNLKGLYLENVTMSDLMDDIQQLKGKERRDFIRYIHYLQNIDKLG